MTAVQRRRRVVAGTAIVAAAVMLSACSTPSASDSAGSSDTISQEEIDKAMSTPTTIDFWSWVPDIQNQIDLFEAKYPEITVKLSNQGGATAQYQKLRAAVKSGDVPDAVQIEYSFLPSFTITNSLEDLAPYGADDLSDQFVDSAWGMVATDDSVWGLPQDLGPTGQLYRTDIFEAAGVEVPTTWDEYAEAAAAIKEKTGSYISDLPGNSFSPILALLWQAGARPFGYDGDKTVTIDLDSEEVTEVIGYWNDLIQADLVDTAPQLDDNWYQSIASGKYASWLAAAWGPVFLQGTAADTSGLWQATEMPQWDASEPASGNQGGSAVTVTADSDAKIVAAEFVKFLTTDTEATETLATEQFIFPSRIETLESPAVRDQEMEFYAGQKVNAVFADIAQTVASDWQWLPYNDYASSSFKETLGAAITEKTDLFDALQEWKDELVSYGESQGFTVVTK
ncbi:ABC transporter substrate-binding protein [Microbacterium allomyrinae]|jgi:multiple sugar transport system substrate-binding protein|uniref:Extracellular solute-binding protein n=1 Tax=Microbacterium allomyrinae TaxID=2830666 RepID=A0A9X1LUY9_9MICO|nr:extracellular solute-binding protein [Microbacterium allomyrinae]MCC2032647.1 extracellular solute-binding protein [Microbacterium allomyrinae]